MSDVQREQLDELRSLRAQAKAQMDAIREVAFLVNNKKKS
jgi:hypothetical protein